MDKYRSDVIESNQNIEEYAGLLDTINEYYHDLKRDMAKIKELEYRANGGDNVVVEDEQTNMTTIAWCSLYLYYELLIWRKDWDLISSVFDVYIFLVVF